MPPASATTRQIEALQALRAFAALLVAFGHMSHEVATMRGPAPPPSLFQSWTGAGVDIFFVISGFVMVYASQRLFGQTGAAPLFLTRRIARIVPLYWLMTSLFLGVMAALPATLNSAAPTVSEILKSYFFVPYVRADQDFMQPVYKLGWTLNYEMFFYVVFAAFIGLGAGRAVGAMAVLFLALAAAGQILEPAPGALYFWTRPIILEFIWGALLALLVLRLGPLSRMAGWGLIAAGFAGFGLWALSGIDPYGPLRPFVWGAASAALVAGAAFMPPAGPGRLTRALVLLGDASYAIYLLHPMVIRALRLVWDKAGLAAMLPGMLFIALALSLTILASLVVHRWFEKPLTRLLQGLRIPVPAAPAAGHPSPRPVPASRIVQIR